MLNYFLDGYVFKWIVVLFCFQECYYAAIANEENLSLEFGLLLNNCHVRGVFFTSYLPL